MGCDRQFASNTAKVTCILHAHTHFQRSLVKIKRSHPRRREPANPKGLHNYAVSWIQNLGSGLFSQWKSESDTKYKTSLCNALAMIDWPGENTWPRRSASSRELQLAAKCAKCVNTPTQPVCWQLNRGVETETQNFVICGLSVRSWSQSEARPDEHVWQTLNYSTPPRQRNAR